MLSEDAHNKLLDSTDLEMLVKAYTGIAALETEPQRGKDLRTANKYQSILNRRYPNEDANQR